MTKNLIISEDQNTVTEFATTFEFVAAETFNCCNATCDFSSRIPKFCIEFGICIPENRTDGMNGYFKKCRP